MRKYWLKTGLSLIAIACLVCLNIAIIPKTPEEVALAKIHRIKIGTAKAEVESILGGRPDNLHQHLYAGDRDSSQCENWLLEGGIGVVFVFFDDHGRVIEKEWRELRRC